MSFNKEQIEYLHSIGKMPTRYYNQLNGKTAQENYNQHKRDRQKQEIPKETEEEIEKQVFETVENAVDKALAELGL